jgi:hypothetical protein
MTPAHMTSSNGGNLADTHEDLGADELSDAPEVCCQDVPVATGLQAFVGTWQMDPRLSTYQDQPPPRSSTQRIEVRDGRVLFHVESVLSDGWGVSYVLSRIPDGVERRHLDPEIADTLLTRIEDRTLETISRRGDLITRHTIRTLSRDGRTLSVTQLGVTGTGRPFRNSSVYHRIA